LAYSAGTTLPAPFANGMFIGQHGSWNRRPHSGQGDLRAFAGGKLPACPGRADRFQRRGQCLGRPVGVVLDNQARCSWPTTWAM
jgi:glucose/arabinose dehydrogenase